MNSGFGERMNGSLGYTASILLIASTILVSSPAQAQSASTMNDNEISVLLECRTESDDLKRLACFDQAAAKFEAAQESGAIVTITKQQIENVERDSFGFNIPSLPNLGLKGLFSSNGSKQKEEKNALVDPVRKPETTEKKAKKKKPNKFEPISIDQVKIPIRKVQTFGYKKIRLFLENGQVWEQIDTERLRLPRKIIKGNEPVAHIEKAALGSFLLKVNGEGRAVRVKRVR